MPPYKPNIFQQSNTIIFGGGVMVGNIKEFITDAFDYPNILMEISIDRAVNRYLLEHIANGFVKYGSVHGFIQHADDWVRSLAEVFPELGFDHKSNQVIATIDLVDQVVVVDDDLYTQLHYIINIISKYGVLIRFTTKDGGTQTTTLSKFFESIEKFYPRITDRHKGLGSSEPIASREVIMDPKTRRISRVTITDAMRTMEQMGVLVGKSDDEVNKRKELLMDFHFTSADIDT